MIPTLPLELYLFATHSATVRFLSLSVSFILSEEGDFLPTVFAARALRPKLLSCDTGSGSDEGSSVANARSVTSGGGFRFLYSFIYLVIYLSIYLSVLGEGAVGDFLLYLGFD